MSHTKTQCVKHLSVQTHVYFTVCAGNKYSTYAYVWQASWSSDRDAVLKGSLAMTCMLQCMEHIITQIIQVN